MGRTTMVDALLRSRSDLMKGRIAMHLGEANVDVLEGFIAGYLASLNDQGIDHLAAIQRFLDFVAEFAALKRSTVVS